MSKDDFFQKRRPPQLLSVLLNRTQGLYSPGQFQRNIVRVWWENDSSQKSSHNRQPSTSQGQPRQKIQLLLKDGPEIVSPHQSLIPTMSYDRIDGRFVLVGSSDGSVSIYDLSKWGSEKFLRRDNYSHRKSSAGNTTNDYYLEDDEQAMANMFHPVARTLRVPSALRRTESGSSGDHNHLPDGHFSSLTHVQWYPIDTGAFVSASLDGSILLWDTNRMQPVLHATPFEEGYTCSCVHLGGGGPGGSNSASSMLVAAGSWQDPAITLVDLRSGAASHQLQGHDRGISCLSWSPTSSVILASGSKDGSIRLWDIRKSGSRACVTQLHRQEAVNDGSSSSSSSTSLAPYSPDYTHLNKFAKQPRRHDTTMERLKQQRQGGGGSGDGGKRQGRETKKEATTASMASRLRQPAPRPAPAPNNYSHVQNNAHTLLRPHNGTVSNLAFFPDGHFMATVGSTDGELVLWDLTKSVGQVVSSKFVAPGGQSAAGSGGAAGGNQQRRYTRIPLCVDRATATIWVGHKTDLLGFHPNGGRPRHVLKGHLHHVTAMETMDHSLQLLTAAADGMILTWGKKRPASPVASTAGQVGERQRLQDEDNW